MGMALVEAIGDAVICLPISRFASYESAPVGLAGRVWVRRWNRWKNRYWSGCGAARGPSRSSLVFTSGAVRCVIVRKERPHPGAQLRFTDADGMRLTCLATTGGPIARLELRHRRRARDTGLRNPPLHDIAQNRIWLDIIQIALDLLT